MLQQKLYEKSLVHILQFKQMYSVNYLYSYKIHPWK